MTVTPRCLEYSLPMQRPRWLCKLSREWLPALWWLCSEFRADWVSGLWRKGNKWSGLGGGIEFLQGRPGKGHGKHKGWQQVLFVSHLMKDLSENPQRSWNNCWRALEVSHAPLHSAKHHWKQALFIARLLLWKIATLKFSRVDNLKFLTNGWHGSVLALFLRR